MSSVFALTALFCQALLGELLLFCLFPAVDRLLALGFLPEPLKGLRSVRMGRWFQPGLIDQRLPGAEISRGQGVYP